MAAPGDIVCVDWRGPFFLRYDTQKRAKGKASVVYRVDHLGVPVYIGCTATPWPYRLYRHSISKNAFGAFLRETPAREITVSVIEGADYHLEYSLIAVERPRFNRNATRWAEAAMLRSQGLTLREVGERMGMSKSAVTHVLVKRGTLGEVDCRKKVSEFDRQVIKRMRWIGLTLREIGEIFGISAVAVKFIVDGREPKSPRKARNVPALPDRMVA